MSNAIQLNARRRQPVEPDAIALLLECHQRIRAFTHLAWRAATEAVTDSERSAACAQCLRYFAHALPLHVADEDVSVMPRLMHVAHTPAATLAALAQMHAQHREHEAGMLAFTAALASVQHAPADASARATLAACAEAMRAAFDEHLANEETHIFPVLAQLPATELAAITDEIRQRRMPPRK